MQVTKRLTSILLILIAIKFLSLAAFAQDINVKPKYGSEQKTADQKEADKEFISTVEKLYKGDKKKAAKDLASKGWQFLQQGQLADAMKRFNQAWLLDSKNGEAIWGMAAAQASLGNFDDSLTLFKEAHSIVGNNLDLYVDQAKVMGIAALQTNDKNLIANALANYESIYKKDPQHTLNLQNWAVVLFYTGDYPGAWEKIKLAENTKNKNQIDKKFVADLSAKMPRPAK